MRVFFAVVLVAFLGTAHAEPKPGPTPNRPPPVDVSKFVGNVGVANVLQVNGELIARSAIFNNLTARGSIVVNGTVQTQGLEAAVVRANVLKAAVIKPPNGVVVVNGDVVLMNAPAMPTAFLAENIVVNGVPQWKLVHHDHFEHGNDGWSLLETSTCSGNDHFLGGHCKIGSGEVSKTFKDLPPHKQIRLTARYHFLDKWAGETAFLKLGSDYVWTKHMPRLSETAQLNGLNVCGGAHPEPAFAHPIEVTTAHSASFLEVAFGSTGSEKQDPCERSFGVDDVMVYVR